MTLLRAIALALLATSTTLPAYALDPVSSETQAELSVEELLHATALDEIFTQFGPAIADAPNQQGLAMPGTMGKDWALAAQEVFVADEMHADLAASLAATMEADAIPVLSEFYRSEFGKKISGIERALTMLDPAGQTAVIESGRSLMSALPSDSPRAKSVEELLQLVGAEITNALVAQSIRGMLIGMTLSTQQGNDIEVPWEEIDRQLEAMMPGMLASLVETQQAMAHFAYRDLSDAELGQYLTFLRDPKAQRFYALAAIAVGKIVNERMSEFGETLAGKSEKLAI